MATARAASLLAAARGLLDTEDPEAAAAARQKAEQALETYQAQGSKDGVLEALHQIITADLVEQQPGEAMRMAKDKLWTFQSAGDRKGEATMLLALAEVHVARREPGKAVEAGKKALALFQKLNDPKQELLVQKALVAAYLLADDNKEALIAANQGLALSKRLSDESVKADACFALLQARMSNDARDTMAAGNEALALYKKVGDRKGEARTLTIMAQCHLSKKDPSSALKPAKDALALWRELGSTKGVLESLDLVVKSFIQCDEPGEALQIVEGEQRRFKQLGDVQGEAGVSLPLFMAHRSQEDQETHANEALQVANDGLQLLRQLGDTKGEADMWLKVSETHLACNMLESTLGEAQEALMLYRGLKDSKGEEQANIVITEVYIRRGEPEKAPLHSKGIDLLSKLADALEARDSNAFLELSEKLQTIGGYGLVTEQEQVSILGPVVSRDPDGATAFMKANSPEAEELEEGARVLGAINHRGSNKVAFYLNFRFGGIAYGPRFRCVDYASALKEERPEGADPTLGVSVLNMQDISDDWEFNLKLHPGILDCALQSGACLGALALPKKKDKK